MDTALAWVPKTLLLTIMDSHLHKELYVSINNKQQPTSFRKFQPITNSAQSAQCMLHALHVNIQKRSNEHCETKSILQGKFIISKMKYITNVTTLQNGKDQQKYWAKTDQLFSYVMELVILKFMSVEFNQQKIL